MKQTVTCSMKLKDEEVEIYQKFKEICYKNGQTPTGNLKKYIEDVAKYGSEEAAKYDGKEVTKYGGKENENARHA